jgi:hypothetical protein
MRIDGPQITGSFNLNGDTVADLDVLVTTSSLNTYTSSVNTTMGHVMTATHSLNTFTSSATTRLNTIEGVTGSYATTGSNVFVGNQTISGSVIPSVTNAYDLGSSTHQFRHIYISSGSLYIDGTKVLGSTTQELQITTDAGQSFKILEAGSDTITLQSADGNITLATSGGGDVIMDPTTGVIALKGTTQIYAGNKVRSSDGNNIVFGDGLTVSGSITVTGFIEAQELRTTYISSSILYRSGSTKFGDELGDTHAFTGSLLVSGSISVPGSGLISGSVQVLNGSGVWSGSAQLPSGVVSGSAQTIANLPSGTVSGSAQILLTGTTGYSTYINQALLTTSNPTFNSVISGDIRYNGTGYITYDVANSGTNSLVVRKFGTTVLTLNSSGYLGVNVDPSFYLDVQSNVANSFYTIAQFENKDYTSGTRSFIRVRNWLSAGGSYSSYFGQGQDGKTYIIANNSARGGDIVIDGGNGYVGVGRSSPAYLFDVGGGSAFRDTLRLLSSDVNTVNISWTGSNNGLVNLYNGGTLGTQILASGLSFFNGSIKINQDAALRAGSGDNWLIGQDSGTNVIHIGSTAVGNDIRFDSSTGSGIVMIKANARLGVNTTDPATTFDVNGYMGLRSNNYFYFGHTTSNIGGWTTRMYADGATHKFNANGFVFNNEGYGSATWLSINSSGNATFSGTVTVNNSITTTHSLFSTRNILAGDPTPLHLNYASSDGVGPAIRLGSGANGFWDVQPSSNNQRLSFEWTDTTNALNIYSSGTVSVGSAIQNTSSKLAVGGAVRANNSVYNWFQAGTNDWDGYQYLHLKTNLSSGANGNVDHTMSLFYGRLYSYSSSYIREGHYGWHNWSGTLYNPVSTGNFWAGGYSSSDGYVVLIVALGGGSYIGMNIDWHQSYPYGFRDRIVTSYNHSNSASALY